ncbi:Global nitrogen regulatory protein, CRP family of transcriptional regulators [hydrothermal vent metagenome]|uniref:Global nitrogen regulatory protein, CRP family of transcriptional regulators n=1 Tax=hydrothermal vent metagenome TaxID=652676 RepID=A0A1W1CY81_9ZZZZ
MKFNNIEIFKKLDQSFEEQFLQYGKVVSFQRRETPFVSDELYRYFYIVLNGKIKTSQMNLETGREITLSIYRHGDMFDILILLDGKVHDVLYEVLEKVELLQLPIEKVREWLKNNEQFNRHFFPYMASQMRNKENLASDLALYDTAERLSKLLIQNMDSTNRYYYQLLQNLSKTEIAKLLGTVRNVVERHLKELERDDIIENRRKDIYVKDIKRLLKDSEHLLLENKLSNNNI